MNSDAGLFTPLIANADNKGLAEIATSVRSLADKAKTGKLTPDELQVSTKPHILSLLVKKKGLYSNELI